MNFRNNLCTSLIVGASVFVALLSGCATAGPKISSHPDTTVDYAGYKTYMMLQPRGLAPAASNPAATPMLIRQLREEAGLAFNAKGLAKSPDAYADVMILVHGSLQDKIEVMDRGFSYGRRGHGFAGQEIDSHREGTLVVDVFDAKTRELVWRGSAVAEISAMPDAATLKATVDSIIARYPN